MRALRRPPPLFVTRTNLLLRSNTFDTTWSGTASAAQSASLGPDGQTLAWDLSDASAAAFQSRAQSVTIPADGKPYTLSLYVRKTAGGTAPTFGIAFNLTGGSTIGAGVRLNTDTGVVADTGTDGSGSENAGNYWRIWRTLLNSGLNTTAAISLFPATDTFGNLGGGVVTAQGSATIFGAQLEQSPFPTAYIPTDTSAASRRIEI